MAGKKGAVAQLQIEVNTEEDWHKLLTKEGLIVVDVYSDWCGPCVGMVGILRKIKLEIGGDMLILATAKSDAIEDLARFRNKSEPTWMFIAGGQMVNLMFGANAPRLSKMIIAELENERLAQAEERKRQTMPFDQLTEEEIVREEKKEAKRLEALAREEAERVAEEARRLEKRLSDAERFMTDYTVVALRPELFEDGQCEVLDALMAALSPDGYKVQQEALVDVDHPVLVQLMPPGILPERGAQEAREGPAEAKKEELLVVMKEEAAVEKEEEDVELEKGEAASTEEAPETVAPAEVRVEAAGDEEPGGEEEVKEAVSARIVLKLLKIDRSRPSEEGEVSSEPEETSSEEALSATAEEEKLDALERVQQIIYVEMPLSDDEVKAGAEKISLLQKFCTPPDVPCIWTPGTAREKAVAILEFFPEAASQYVVLEPEPLPPHVTLMFDTMRMKAAAALVEEHRDDVLDAGFFSGADPASARKLASTLDQYERLPTRNGGEILVVVINRTRSEPLLSFCLHTPFYISPNVEDGARLREAFFPPGADDEGEEEATKTADKSEPAEESLLDPKDHEIDPDSTGDITVSPETSALAVADE